MRQQEISHVKCKLNQGSQICKTKSTDLRLFCYDQLTHRQHERVRTQVAGYLAALGHLLWLSNHMNLGGILLLSFLRKFNS